ncbi:MAG: Secretion protein HlyD [Oscillospiraceae bacterium]
MNSPRLRRFAASVIAFLLLLYVGYQIYRSHYSSVQTETASYFTASESVHVNGIAIRDEVLLQEETEGVVDYILSDGDKISKGGTVALIYSNEQQVAARHEMEHLDREIKQLQELQSPGNTFAASPDSLNEQIHLQISNMLSKTIFGEFSELETSREDIQSLMNERRIVTDQVDNFDERLNQLQQEYDTLSQQVGTALGRITAPASGYFISSTDGFETAIDFSAAASLNCSQIQQVLDADKSEDTALGKISRSYEWYFAFTVSSEQAAGFRQLADGGTVSLQFPFVSNLVIPATVAAVNQTDADSPAAVILRCNYMNSALAPIRKETAQVIVRQYTGIRISNKALHFETLSKTIKDENGNVKTEKKEVCGAYVLHGNQIHFRQVVPLYSTENYVICDPNPDNSDLMTSQTIKLHDEVVVEGTDLYDGKIVQ